MAQTAQEKQFGTFDVSILGILRAQGTSIYPTHLKRILDAEVLKSHSTRKKIRFIDCQSRYDNGGYEFKRPVHMNIENALKAPDIYTSTVASVAGTMNDLAAADIVVVYCHLGQQRSPLTHSVHCKAVLGHPNENRDQKVLLLDGGITAYLAVDRTGTYVAPWTGPPGKTLAYIGNGVLVVPKANSGKTTQPTGDAGSVMSPGTQHYPQPEGDLENLDDVNPDNVVLYL